MEPAMPGAGDPEVSDRVVCFFCRHSGTGKLGDRIVLKCRLTRRRVDELDTCERAERYRIRSKEDRHGTQETDG